MRARGIGVRDQPREVRPAGAKQVAARKRAAPKAAKKDDIEDMDEIEAILKRHGI
jgi:hypothetical protein